MTSARRIARVVCLGLTASLVLLAAGARAQRGDALSAGFLNPPPDTASSGARIMTSPGFSHTGDAAVKPEEAMKKLVWTTTRVSGGRPFNGMLAAPPDNSGPFQNFAYGEQSPWTTDEAKAFYRDVAVMAYRVPDIPPAAVAAISSGAGPIDGARLAAGDPKHSFMLTGQDGKAFVRFDYPEPQTIRTAVLATPEIRIDMPMFADLEALGDAGQWRHVATLDMRNDAHVTTSFAPVRAKSFRFVFARRPMNYEPIVPYGGPDVAVSPGAIPFFKKMREPSPDFPIAELALRSDGRVREFERKAGFFTFVNDYYALATPKEAANAVTRKGDVIDLTGRLGPNGSLDWTPPPGNWDILRLGYSLTGAVSHPGPPNQVGLEVDKFDAGLMKTYLTRQLDREQASAAGRNAHWLFADSIEAGPQNWTGNLVAEFQKRRGYDPRPYFPALTGVVIDSPAATDKFLWDYRQTLADLLHEATYKTIADMGHAHGLKVAMEALETGRFTFGDDFQMRRYADQPVGALWASSPTADYLKEFPNEVADQRGAASIAHVYGQPIVGAESGTDLEHPGTTSPRALKPMVDLEFAFGVNSLQRTGAAPGDTWAAYAQDWDRYLARTAFMLQQGAPVEDVAYYYGQEAPLVSQREKIADTPRRNSFDFINTEALTQAVTVRNGRLVVPSGVEYRVLQLGGSSRMLTTAVLKRLKDLVTQGLIVVGAAPVDTPSLSDDPAEFRRLRARLWGADGKGAKLGKGKVLGANTVDQALASLGVGPDLTAQGMRVGTDILFQHRRAGDADIYYVVSRPEKGGPVTLSFRQTGKAPELWRADSGEQIALPYRIEGGRTLVRIDFRPTDAVFIVFRSPAKGAKPVAEKPQAETLARLDDGWTVTFPGGRGAPNHVADLSAGSWGANTDPAIRYFSGTATYARSFDVLAGSLAGGKVILSLGEVRDLADVSVNGTPVGVRWAPPYHFDITSALKPGENRIEVKVVNLAVNRMIGAAQPRAAPPAGTPPARGGGGLGGLVEYKPDAPLRPSGILGPVTLIHEGPPQTTKQ